MGIRKLFTGTLLAIMLAAGLSTAEGRTPPPAPRETQPVSFVSASMIVAGEREFLVTPSTKVLDRQGGAISIMRIERRMKVVIDYHFRPADGKPVADRIQIK